MAQAHLSSLDMSSVDKEDLSSGGEEEETGRSSGSDPGKSDIQYRDPFFQNASRRRSRCGRPFSQKSLFLGSDLTEEGKSLRDQRASADALAEKADPSLHQLGGQGAKEGGEELGE